MSQEEQQAMVAQIAEQQRRAQSAASPVLPPETAVTEVAPVPAVQEVVEAAAPKDGFVETDPSTWGNPGRNDSCPCGSGKKFKHCHGAF